MITKTSKFKNKKNRLDCLFWNHTISNDIIKIENHFEFELEKQCSFGRMRTQLNKNISRSYLKNGLEIYICMEENHFNVEEIDEILWKNL